MFINNVPSNCSATFTEDSDSSCEFQWKNETTPVVTNVSPDSGPAGTLVTITGGFSAKNKLSQKVALFPTNIYF